MSQVLLGTSIFFVATFTHSLAGFGAAMIAMPLLIEMLGIRVAAPLQALVGVTILIILLVRYRGTLNPLAVGRLSATSLLGIPLGVLALRHVNEKIVLMSLGVVIMGYALYAFLNLRLPEIRHPGWAYGFGFLAGLLTGAYNCPAPVVVIYGSCRRWRPAEFKSNLQGFFLLNSAIVVSTHALTHNFTSLVWKNYLIALPAIGLGLWVGASLDKYLNPAISRKIVLVLLMILGLRLILK